MYACARAKSSTVSVRSNYYSGVETVNMNVCHKFVWSPGERESQQDRTKRLMMSKGCVKIEYPKRGRQCYEVSAYMANYVGCVKCKKRLTLPMSKRQIVVKRTVDNDTRDEEVTFLHKCPSCSHVICEHFWSSTYYEDKNVDVYLMECMLCGRGQKEVPRSNPNDLAGMSEDTAPAAVKSTKGPPRKPVKVEDMMESASAMGAALRSAAKSKLAARKKAADAAGDTSDSDWED